MIDKNNLNTGDILLFNEKNNFNNCYNFVFSIITSCIEKLTNSRYAHCAMIIKDPDFKEFSKKGLYIFQSSFEAFPDAEDGKYKFGVEIEEFDKVVNSAKEHGKIYVRKLECIRDKDFKETLSKVHELTYNKPYDFYPKHLIETIIQRKTNNYQDTNRFICSALLAFTYVKWGFLQSDTQWTVTTPEMFGTEENNEKKLIFTDKCVVEKEEELIL